MLFEEKWALRMQRPFCVRGMEKDRREGRSLKGRDAGEQSRPRGGGKEARQQAAGQEIMAQV